MVSQASLSSSQPANTPAALDAEQEATLRAVVIESFGDLFTAYGFTVRLLERVLRVVRRRLLYSGTRAGSWYVPKVHRFSDL